MKSAISFRPAPAAISQRAERTGALGWKATLWARPSGIADLAGRIEHLRRFEKWGALKPLSFGDLVGKEPWDQHWAHLKSITEAMKVAQSQAEHLRDEIKNTLASKAPDAD